MLGECNQKNMRVGLENTLWTKIKQFRFPVDVVYINELKRKQKILDNIQISEMWLSQATPSNEELTGNK